MECQADVGMRRTTLIRSVTLGSRTAASAGIDTWLCRLLPKGSIDIRARLPGRHSSTADNLDVDSHRRWAASANLYGTEKVTAHI